eukprot:8127920-Pyramimonas_sp.AAC.1
MLPSLVTSLVSLCARRFALSCADRTAPLPCISLRNLFALDGPRSCPSSARPARGGLFLMSPAKLNDGSRSLI